MTISTLLDKWLDSKDTEYALRLFAEAEKLALDDNLDREEKSVWFRFLEETSKPSFLKLLSEEQRYRWAEAVFRIIQHTQFGLVDLFEHRVKVTPNKTLFQEYKGGLPVKWSYIQVAEQVREFAALFYNAQKEPRVAIYAQNHMFGAMTDLACLFYGIFDTPLNVHFNEKNLVRIFDLLNINIAVTDSPARLSVLLKVRKKVKTPFIIYTTYETAELNSVRYLLKSAMELKKHEVDQVINSRKRKPLNAVATTMFTSGSTGVPKGVSFSYYNLISKRFARGAALPFLGSNEVFLSYLPLFHTFGRYLEMLGTIYWRGTYVFVGNNSAETLLKLFPQIEPTVFISIPLRWLDLYNKILSQGEHLDERIIKEKITALMGRRFKWGLSAAGYLDPKVFTFFQKHGINLCSGFGMTEATGGITMTPPWEYKENSVGKPLPGVYTRLRRNGELEISGHYIARYLEDKGPGDIIPYPKGDETDYWLPTGDIFEIDSEGHHKIVDRVKDIYKNNKGQTIAPRVVEEKFKGVPGIKQVFLVGDARPYNVLLIVPDLDAPVVTATHNIEEYYRQIINAANKEVAPYERVVNFAILDREFSTEKGELTPKGSFNRKTIERNFKHIIDRLYKSNEIVLDNGKLKVSIPRWFFRDLGILETDIELHGNLLVNKTNGATLYVRHFRKNCYFIGDLLYRLESNTLNLGILARQPKLWIGNVQFINFAPLKEGWDIPLEQYSERVRMQGDYQVIYLEEQIPDLKNTRNPVLNSINRLVIKAYFSPEDQALKAIEELGSYLQIVDKNTCSVVRLRLQGLAYSPYESIRVLAYRILLLDDPSPDYKRSFPEFLISGKTYINEESINIIARSNIGKQQLQALRERLYTYRTKLKWNLNETRLQHFEYIFRLLYNFTLKNFEFLPTVRAELSSWALHKDSPKLAEAAREYLSDLHENFGKFINKRFENVQRDWDKLIVFGTDISEAEKERLLEIFDKTHFIEQSVILAFNEPNFSLENIGQGGIWIVKMLMIRDFYHYRVSINTKDGAHYDLHFVLSRSLKRRFNTETPLWMNAISGHPVGRRVLPMLGCNFPDYGIFSTEYVVGLTVWDKIKEYTNIHKSANFAIRQKHWRKLFVRAFSAFFTAWKYSGRKIIPGIISPNNVTVPELDFKQNTMLVTLTGWKTYHRPLELVVPMVREFYLKVNALYPWTRNMLKIDWIFDAIIESLKIEKGKQFLEELRRDLTGEKVVYNGKNLSEYLDEYLLLRAKSFYFPLALYSAIEQYAEWRLINPMATSSAKSLTIVELIELYRLNNYPEIVRYKFYAETYFRNASDEVKEKFEILLDRMAQEPYASPLQFVELSDLQSVIDSDEDMEVFSRMVFPKIKSDHKVEIERKPAKDTEHLVVKSVLHDKFGSEYIFREPLQPSEVGQLYQLFYKENYPKEINELDKHLVLVDKYDRIIGGLAYRELDNNIVLLDGMVITSTLQGRGLGTAMIEDFFARMGAQGVKVIKAHFLFGNYYLKHNFRVDERWGALVRYLD